MMYCSITALFVLHGVMMTDAFGACVDPTVRKHVAHLPQYILLPSRGAAVV